MECPMLVNNPSAQKHRHTVDVTAHEIAHSYFPFLVLTNETSWGWMDEAFAAKLPYRYQERTDPSLNRLTRYAESLSSAAVSEYNLPVMTPSDLLTGRTYYLTAYSKPALALYYLEELLGRDQFRNAIRGYIRTW
jgi:aminopeptidase N